MAQDFERNKARNVGTSASSLRTSNGDDAIVGINVANTTTSQITIQVFINDGSNDFYIVKNAPIPAGSALQVLDGGAKIVMQNNDILKVQSSADNSADVWVSAVDDIST
tara:strand:+ start:954 stop:1280 length:327 start_codon:yes stop_codon:yes gene_type:complete